MEENKERLKISKVNIKVMENLIRVQKKNLEMLGNIRDEITSREVKKDLDKLLAGLYEATRDLENQKVMTELQIKLLERLI